MKEGSADRIEWAYRHPKIKKSADWFWILGISAGTLAIIAVLIDNLLFAVVVVLGALGVALNANRNARDVHYTLSHKGVTIGQQFYPMQSLESFHIDDVTEEISYVRLKSEHMLTPLISLPIADDDIASAIRILRAHLKEEHLEEPFSHKIVEFLGF